MASALECPQSQSSSSVSIRLSSFVSGSAASAARSWPSARHAWIGAQPSALNKSKS